MSLIWLAVVFLVYVTHSQSDGCGTIHIAGSVTTHTIQHDGIQRTYIVKVPQSYDRFTATPLIFGFPGYTISANYFSNYFGMNIHTDSLQSGYLAVYAQATSFQNGNQNVISWNDIGCSGSPGPEGCIGQQCNLATCNNNHYNYPVPSDCPNDPPGCNWCNCHANDVDFVDFLANYIEDNYCVDVTREYALGYSQGGMMTQRVGCELDRFAAIAPFAGQQARGFNCGPKYNAPIGIINVWGTRDNVVPGTGAVASDGYWYTSVADVQSEFAEHDGCDTSAGTVNIASPSDGISSWTCSGYTGTSHGCDNYGSNPALQCNYNGNHNYPKYNPNQQNSENFALPTVWQFFQQFQRLDRLNGTGIKAKKYYNYTIS